MTERSVRAPGRSLHDLGCSLSKKRQQVRPKAEMEVPKFLQTFLFSSLPGPQGLGIYSRWNAEVNRDLIDFHHTR